MKSVYFFESSVFLCEPGDLGGLILTAMDAKNRKEKTIRFGGSSSTPTLFAEFLSVVWNKILDDGKHIMSTDTVEIISKRDGVEAVPPNNIVENTTIIVDR